MTPDAYIGIRYFDNAVIEVEVEMTWKTWIGLLVAALVLAAGSPAAKDKDKDQDKPDKPKSAPKAEKAPRPEKAPKPPATKPAIKGESNKTSGRSDKSKDKGDAKDGERKGAPKKSPPVAGLPVDKTPSPKGRGDGTKARRTGEKDKEHVKDGPDGGPPKSDPAASTDPVAGPPPGKSPPGGMPPTDEDPFKRVTGPVRPRGVTPVKVEPPNPAPPVTPPPVTPPPVAPPGTIVQPPDKFGKVRKHKDEVRYEYQEEPQPRTMTLPLERRVQHYSSVEFAGAVRGGWTRERGTDIVVSGKIISKEPVKTMVDERVLVILENSHGMDGPKFLLDGVDVDTMRGVDVGQIVTLTCPSPTATAALTQVPDCRLRSVER